MQPRRILIVKLGSASPTLIQRRGDYEDYFAGGIGVPIGQCQVVDPVRGEPLPDPEGLAGILLTGSDAMVTENHPWSLRTQTWLARVLTRKVPVFGICYGHQLLAQALGGTVGWNPNGLEVGTITVGLSEAAHTDPLFGGLPDELVVQAYHSQSVLTLPREARVLAGNAHDALQGFAWGESAWGVQFHPEFDAGISRIYIEDERTEISEEGLDPDQLLLACKDSTHGAELLRRFANFALNGSNLE